MCKNSKTRISEALEELYPEHWLLIRDADNDTKIPEFIPGFDARLLAEKLSSMFNCDIEVDYEDTIEMIVTWNGL